MDQYYQVVGKPSGTNPDDVSSVKSEEVTQATEAQDVVQGQPIETPKKLSFYRKHKATIDQSTVIFGVLLGLFVVLCILQQMIQDCTTKGIQRELGSLIDGLNKIKDIQAQHNYL